MNSIAYICVCVSVLHECHGACMTLRDPFQRSVLSFYHVGHKDQTQIFRLDSKLLYLLSRLLPWRGILQSSIRHVSIYVDDGHTQLQRASSKDKTIRVNLMNSVFLFLNGWPNCSCAIAPGLPLAVFFCPFPCTFSWCFHNLPLPGFHKITEEIEGYFLSHRYTEYLRALIV